MNYKIIDNTPIQGLRRVMANNKYGIINQNNQLICEIIYDEIAHPYPYERRPKHILVKRNGKWTAKDMQGKTIISLEMDLYIDFFNTNDHYAIVVVNEKRHIIDRYGNILTKRFENENIVGIEFFGKKFAFLEKSTGKAQTLITAYDIEKDCTPDFWKTITNCVNYYVTWIEWIDAFENDEDADGNMLFRTMTKEYRISPFGEILNVNNLSAKRKIAHGIVKVIGSFMKD
jgi:hypothetical protein